MDEFRGGKRWEGAALWTDGCPDRGRGPFLEAGMEPRGLPNQNTVSPSTKLESVEGVSEEEESARHVLRGGDGDLQSRGQLI